MSRVRYPVRWKLLLSLAALLVGLVASELFYRGMLWLELAARSTRPDFYALNKPLLQFDAKFGYSYAPGESIITCVVRRGAIHTWHSLTIDANGNMAEPPSTAPEPVKVLIFGDSFTSNPYQPFGWPHFFARDSTFQVHNFARAGYGLLQMIDLAAAKTRELEPDFIIVAFIMEDLIRARAWHTVVDIDGQPTPVVGADPSRLHDPAFAMETGVIDPALTTGWCQAQMARPDPSDPLLVRLNARYQSMAGRRQRNFLLNPQQSLLVNLLAHHDPYHGMRTPTITPKTPLKSFEADAQFVSAIKSINVPMLLIVLPNYDELATQDSRPTKRMLTLLHSLQTLTGSSPHFLFQSMGTPGNIERLFLLPEDQHPSAAGSEAYATAIAMLVEESGMAQ
ncbi:MAG: hypothetical protein SGI90_00295 [Candidatus Eisenbacteria bacterium]|nr:hypothetical protein [Candidatus Eisenbacteria bacterium]